MSDVAATPLQNPAAAPGTHAGHGCSSGAAAPRPALPHIVTAVPGPKSLALFETEQKFISPGLQRMSLLAKLAISHGKGATLTDLDGNTYVDFIAGVAVASIGHSHPKFIAAMEDQVRKNVVGSFTSPVRAELLQRIAAVTPGDLKKTQLYSGGAEAVEAAVRLAKSHTKRFEIMGFWGGFHGKTGGVLPLIGDEFKQGWGPLAPGVHLAPYADCYRCPLKLAYSTCGIACLDFVRQQIKSATAGSLAAIIAEPMQGTAGNIVPPPEFIPGVRALAKELGALFIADEMITGMGRTGKWFAVNHTNTVPDIMTVGKGLGAGFPVSGLISTEEITQAKPYAKPSSSSSSYGGNAFASAAANVTLKTIAEEGLVEHSARMGEYFLARLRGMQERLRIIGDVRGRGLFLGMDLVKDRTTKEPLDGKMTEWIYMECLRRGLLCMNYSPRVRINPPLTVTPEEADAGLGVLEEVLTLADAKVGK
ncbi:MAG: aspartate aminotransferase family protein [Planctomycetes bacterium]|nr:aspartate aminotransferase family protein [Planctomycetota bacterium]